VRNRRERAEKQKTEAVGNGGKRPFLDKEKKGRLSTSKNGMG